ncbi:low molecular weight protein-tyrosine-phosphatase [Streptomyces profundus]|uniref:low molecular weight protein-tyrosine-phosphatase n=1 Tax=Streptomyces profundus TaxID=2867410 RepID=UPI001D169B06|nr:low molecular weight protein-tyrosine-phosphatase [Streptomyces sp. MA3_2.13]UED85360.1 low molecular weight phosphotyrosine protein phosphatase [Streptomyces sp. MA3_2.13]
MYRICFVCTGNICRSPMAEAALRARLVDEGLDTGIVVESAGTGDWHVGMPADPRAVSALNAAGYPAGPKDHTARRFAADWFDRYDLVIALDLGHQRELRGLAPDQDAADKIRLLRSFAAPEDGGAGAADVEVPDPYYGTDEGFADCLDIIESALPGLLSTVRDHTQHLT